MGVKFLNSVKVFLSNPSAYFKISSASSFCHFIYSQLIIAIWGQELCPPTSDPAPSFHLKTPIIYPLPPEDFFTLN